MGSVRWKALGRFALMYLVVQMISLGIVDGVAERPVTAHAEEASFDPGPPKGVVGQDGVACVGKASQDGHSLTYTVYVGADEGEMSSNPSRERSWQSNYCQWALEQDMGGWFKYQWGVSLDPSNIKVSVRRL
jgi:hypothetical protein